MTHVTAGEFIRRQRFAVEYANLAIEPPFSAQFRPASDMRQSDGAMDRTKREICSKTLFYDEKPSGVPGDTLQGHRLAAKETGWRFARLCL